MNQIRLSQLVGIGATLAAMALLPIGAYAASDDSSQSTSSQSTSSQSTSSQSTSSQSTSSQSTSSQSTFSLTITENQESRNVTLKCDPTGGDHPRASAACDELRAVDGHFQDLNAESKSTEACTKERQKVSASATGFWKDRQVNYQFSTDNLCKLQRSTGSVFSF
jgi:hypothetical protein